LLHRTALSLPIPWAETPICQMLATQQRMDEKKSVKSLAKTA
jgi:hypothetical protein